MKKILLLMVAVLMVTFVNAQTTGDLAFTGMNVDGGDDFAFVTFVELPANTEIYFCDNESNGSGGFNDTNEGTILWNSGGTAIPAGTVIIMTDISNSGTLSTSIGTVSYADGNMNFSGNGDACFAFLGTSESNPTTFLAAVANESGNYGNLTGTGLTDGTTAFTFTASGSPDGGAYNFDRSGQVDFTDYRALISTISNWSTESTNGENILPFNSTAFTIAPVPVELTRFTARATTSTVELDWATATEENNAYFAIERSINGLDFEEIGRVEGAGTTYDAQNYTFKDVAPVNGKNYYRLRQVDFDGGFEYHNVVLANFTGKSTAVAILPTEVNNQFDIVFGEATNKTVQLDIFSINGQLMQSESVNVNSNRQTINVADLNAGLYIVRININNTIVTKRFVKL